MNTVIGADTAKKLAGLQIDMWQKYRAGHITLEHLEWFSGLTKDARDIFVAAGNPVPKPTVTPVVVIKAANRDLNWWIAKTEEFTKKHLGVVVDLRKQFAIPSELPWSSSIPVFDPGDFTNRDMVKKALTGLGLDVYEEVDVMKYGGSEKNKVPTLHFIADSKRPDDDTVGMSPNQLRKTDKSFLRLHGYGLAFAVYYFATGEYLDPETFTWFPEDRLSGGSVAYGHWDPGARKVRFSWNCPARSDGYYGARVAIPVSLNP